MSSSPISPSKESKKIKFSLKVPHIDFSFDTNKELIFGIAEVDPQSNSNKKITDFFGANRWKVFDVENKKFEFQV